MERVKLSMLGGLALATPLQGYSYVPYLDVSFSALLIFGILGLWMARWRTNPIRMPWEYWWPALVTLVFVTRTGVFLDALAPLLAMLVAVQFTRSRARAEYLMWLVTCSLGTLALCNVVSHQAGFAPTGHSLYSRATFVGAYSVSHGVFLLAIGVVWGAYVTLFSKLGPGLRTSAFFGAFFCFGALGGKIFLLRGQVYDWNASITTADPASILIAGAALLWLACRIAAKLWVTRESSKAIVFALGGTALFGAVYWALFPADFAVYPGVMLGIAAGYALPDREEIASTPRFPAVAAVLTVALIAVNTQQAYPFNERDGRNVRYVLQKDWDSGAIDQAHRRASNLLLVYPEKSAELYGWMAEASLALGDLERASKELAMAGAARDESTDERVVERLDVAVIELRDAVSQSDRANVSFAYERALVGMGERGSALAVLKMKVDSGLVNLPHAWTRDEMAFVYAALLGDLSLESEIAAWDSLVEPVGDALWGGLVSAEGVPAPVFWMVDRWPDRCVLYTVLGGRTDVSERKIEQEWIGSQTGSVVYEVFAARADEEPERAGWYVIMDGAGEVASFRLEDGRLTRSSLRETGLELLPYTPVARLHTAE